MDATINPISEKILVQARKSIAGGANSSMRVLKYHLPTVIQKAEGVYIWDADGHKLIDMNMGYGPLIFGHRSPIIINAIENELKLRGTTLGFPHELSHQAAELIKKSFPSINKLRFSSTGTESVQTAIRLARQFTGRKHIVLFEGHYHGSSDSVFHAYHAPVDEIERRNYIPLPGTKGMGGAPYNAYVLPWNDAELLQSFLYNHSEEIAAVIMEPVMGNAGTIPPVPGFLEAARKLTTEIGALLVFDEIITGFRVARGGAQERYGVQSDITLLSKAMNGGVPTAAIGAREEVADLIAHREVFHGGVYSGNPMCIAATLAAQQEYEKNHTEIYTGLENASTNLALGIRKIFYDLEIPVSVQHVGAMLNFWFLTDYDEDGGFKNYREVYRGTNHDTFVKFQHILQQNGVYVHPNHYEPWFISTAHNEAVIGDVLDRIQVSAKTLKKKIQVPAQP
ncbi:aspartate aminotransferase family protein [Ohtaekwangia sp.]|uniref:aspartate aminotransferase family protein n=1 Tax=Ohtaekwangia sp. TaxID=2066019 RepID=UPI002FDD3515